MKIAILGYSGSGKSTLARKLGESLNIPVLHLDTVQFEAGWKERDTAEGLAIVTDFISNHSWITDGNYNKFLQAERLEQADYIIFLNFSRFNCLLRAYRRYFKYRGTTREDMTDGCVEKIDLDFFWWLIYKGRTNQRQKHYQSILDKYPNKAIVLKNQCELDQIISNPREILRTH